MERSDAGSPVQGWDEPPSDGLLTGRVLGDFVLHELIGAGGFGTVYRAEQRALGREVVIKVAHRRTHKRHAHRFLREAQIASQIDHPYAAHIYAFGVENDGLRWLAMELVRGVPLDERLDFDGPVALEQVVPLLEKLCEVVYTAHQQGIVHRDIKPANIMLISPAGQLLPKLLDLGIARLADTTAPPADALANAGTQPYMAQISDESRDEPVMGSPAYMAPEQWIDAGRADARTDQYAIAIVAYEMLTGELPFRAPSENTMALAHATQPVPPLGDHLPAALDEVLTRSLAKLPQDRYGDVLEFAAAFRAASAVEPDPEHQPQLDLAVRETMLGKAPPPLADAVAALDGARTARQSLAAAAQIVEVAIRLCGVIAVAAASRFDTGTQALAQPGSVSAAASDAARTALARLRRTPLSSLEWLALTRAVLRPFAPRPDVHALPELVRLFFGPDGEENHHSVLDTLLTYVRAQLGRAATDGDGDSDSDGGYDDEFPSDDSFPPVPSDEPALAELMPALSRALTVLAFLCNYALVVRRAGRIEAWVGVRRARRLAVTADTPGMPGDGEVVLATSTGAPVLALTPLCQLLAPAPGVSEELFWFDGPGRYGARLRSFPIGFERQDEDFWDHFDHQHTESATTDDGEPAAPESERAPYLGLAAFSPEDAGFYVGREREIEACVNRLKIDPVIAVVGPSGAGKSSFVQAGLVSALSERWRAVTVRPGPTPLATLAARLAQEGLPDGDNATLEARLAADPKTLGAIVRTAAVTRGERWLLIVDQLEELVTLCRDADEQQHYAQALMQVAREPDDPVRLVLTLRDDFLVRIQDIPALRGSSTFNAALQILTTPPIDELERIVVEPARRSGYAFEDAALPREMVAEVAGEPDALVLLSFTAARLWDLRDQNFRRLTRRAYDTLGGVGGALGQHAEETLARMSPARVALVREAFRQLVTADGTRAVLSRGDIAQLLVGDEAEAVIEELIAARLLVASEGESGEDRIEVVHETLLSSWSRLVEWQREDAESARLRDQIRAAARQWRDRGRPDGLLWRGDALLEYRMWRRRYQGALTAVEEGFARASIGAAARAQKLRRAVLISAFLVLSAGLAVIALMAHQARLQTERAERSAQESEHREQTLYLERGRLKLLDDAPMQAFAYLAEAHRRRSDSGAHSPDLDFLLDRAADALAGQQALLSGHDDTVFSARFSPDGALVATASADATAKIWDLSTGAVRHTLTGHTGEVWMVDFSPDGDRLLSAGWDGAVKVWDPASGALLWSGEHDDRVAWAGFDPSGALVASVGRDRVARLWDAESGQLLHTLSGHNDWLSTAAFRPSGDLLATGGGDRRVRIWDVASGRELAVTEELEDAPWALAIDPAGERLAVAVSAAGAPVRLYPLPPLTSAERPTAGAPPAPLTGVELAAHAALITHVRFSPDGRELLTTSNDTTARLWDVATLTLESELRGHASGLTDGQFMPDGGAVVTVSRDGTALTWGRDTAHPRWRYVGHREGIWTVDVSADGQRMVTAGFDGTARVWDSDQMGAARSWPLPTGAKRVALAPTGEVALEDHTGAVEIRDRDGRQIAELPPGPTPVQLSWNPTGTQLLVVRDQTVTRWSARDGAQTLPRDPLAAPGTTAAPLQAEFDRRGELIATLHADGTIALWRADSGAHVRTLALPTDGDAGPTSGAEVTAIALAPDATALVTAHGDGAARLWDISGDMQLTARLDGHRGALTAAEFSSDGRSILTAADDGSAALWSRDGSRTASLQANAGSTQQVALSQSQRYIATLGNDGAAALWDLHTGAQLWALELPSVTARAIGFGPDDQSLMIANERVIERWTIAPTMWSDERIARFVQCRVEYRVDARGSLSRARPSGAPCRDQ